MLKKNRAGKLPSLIIVGEELGAMQPLLVCVGRYRSDPARAVGHVAIMKRKLIAWATDQAPDLENE